MRGRTVGWQVEVGAAVEPFEEAWRALAGSAHATPFQSFDLMRVFYRQLAGNGGAEPVVALVRHADGRPAALFPMMRSRRHGLNWLHTDARPLDYCAPLIDRSLAPAEAGSAVRAMLVAVPRADLLYVNRIPQCVGGLENPLLSLPNAARLRFSSWTLPLAGRTWDELAAAQTKRFRSNLRSYIQRLERAHDRRFAISFGTDISARDWSEFKRLRAESLSEKGRSDILGDAAWGGFYDALIRDSGTCRAWLATLRADGRMIAGLYGFVEAGRVQVILPAMLLGEWKSFSPGTQLFHETINHFYQSGADVYDLSIGDMAYKARFGCVEGNVYDALFPKTLAGHVFYAFWRAKVKIRAKLKPIAADT